MKPFKMLHALTIIRRYSVKAKPTVIADENVLDDINKSVFKPRKHPGIMQPKTVTLPDAFVKAAVNVMADYPVKTLVSNSEKLVNHLRGRVPPMEPEEIKDMTRNVKQKVMSQLSDVAINSEEVEKKFQQILQNKVNKILSKKIYNWQPIKYDEYNSLLYLVARSAAEYAVLVKIFGEIAARDPTFKPQSIFDFGSGVGTATWAANVYWKRHFFEYFNVDASREMNDLAEALLQGGVGTGVSAIKGVFYRQFLPVSKNTYDLVISAYSLLELNSLQSRLQTILNLWNKTQNYLVIVEQGTNAGFKVVNEIRDFILQTENKSSIGHVFSPCPHDDTCPRFLLDDGTPCNFEVNYFTLPIGRTSEPKRELYSYVVLKKGKRGENDLQWPRIVRPTLVRSKHSICRVCTASGKLNEVIFTASKHGKVTYHCARSSKWGDLLPVTLDEKIITDENNIESSGDTDHECTEK